MEGSTRRRWSLWIMFLIAQCILILVQGQATESNELTCGYEDSGALFPNDVCICETNAGNVGEQLCLPTAFGGCTIGASLAVTSVDMLVVESTKQIGENYEFVVNHPPFRGYRFVEFSLGDCVVSALPTETSSTDISVVGMPVENCRWRAKISANFEKCILPTFNTKISSNGAAQVYEGQLAYAIRTGTHSSLSGRSITRYAHNIELKTARFVESNFDTPVVSRVNGAFASQPTLALDRVEYGDTGFLRNGDEIAKRGFTKVILRSVVNHPLQISITNITLQTDSEDDLRPTVSDITTTSCTIKSGAECEQTVQFNIYHNGLCSIEGRYTLQGFTYDCTAGENNCPGPINAPATSVVLGSPYMCTGKQISQESIALGSQPSAGPATEMSKYMTTVETESPLLGTVIAEDAILITIDAEPGSEIQLVSKEKLAIAYGGVVHQIAETESTVIVAQDGTRMRISIPWSTIAAFPEEDTSIVATATVKATDGKTYETTTQFMVGIRTGGENEIEQTSRNTPIIELTTDEVEVGGGNQGYSTIVLSAKTSGMYSFNSEASVRPKFINGRSARSVKIQPLQIGSSEECIAGSPCVQRLAVRVNHNGACFLDGEMKIERVPLICRSGIAEAEGCSPSTVEIQINIEGYDLCSVDSTVVGKAFSIAMNVKGARPNRILEHTPGNHVQYDVKIESLNKVQLTQLSLNSIFASVGGCQERQSVSEYGRLKLLGSGMEGIVDIDLASAVTCGALFDPTVVLLEFNFLCEYNAGGSASQRRRRQISNSQSSSSVGRLQKALSVKKATENTYADTAVAADSAVDTTATADPTTKEVDVPEEQSTSVSMGIIIGVVVGVLVLIGLIACLIVLWVMRRNRKRKSQQKQQPMMVTQLSQANSVFGTMSRDHMNAASQTLFRLKSCPGIDGTDQMVMEAVGVMNEDGTVDNMLQAPKTADPYSGTSPKTFTFDNIGNESLNAKSADQLNSHIRELERQKRLLKIQQLNREISVLSTGGGVLPSDPQAFAYNDYGEQPAYGDLSALRSRGGAGAQGTTQALSQGPPQSNGNPTDGGFPSRRKSSAEMSARSLIVEEEYPQPPDASQTRGQHDSRPYSPPAIRRKSVGAVLNQDSGYGSLQYSRSRSNRSNSNSNIGYPTQHNTHMNQQPQYTLDANHPPTDDKFNNSNIPPVVIMKPTRAMQAGGDVADSDDNRLQHKKSKSRKSKTKKSKEVVEPAIEQTPTAAVTVQPSTESLFDMTAFQGV